MKDTRNKVIYSLGCIMMLVFLLIAAVFGLPLAVGVILVASLLLAIIDWYLTEYYI